jgi:hypothetical protein
MMLYDWERKLTGSFLGLPLGVRRLWIATSVLWLVAYLAFNWADMSLYRDRAMHGSGATCADVYPNDASRRSACDLVNGRPDIRFYMQGKSNSFEPYFDKYRRDDKLLIWLGAPFVWLAIIWAFMWVRQGFETDQAK